MTFSSLAERLKAEGRLYRERKANLPLAGGLFKCAYCGSGVMGERIRRRLKGGDMAQRVFEWTQRLAETWRGSKMATRREILESVTLNRTVCDVSLCTRKRKPFGFLAEGRLVQNGTPCRIQTCDLWLRRPALYSLS